MKTINYTLLFFCTVSLLLFNSWNFGSSNNDSCVTETFDEDPFAFGSWQNTGDQAWHWSPDGTARGGEYWTDSQHQGIKGDFSDSRAIVFNSDSLNAVGILPPHLGIAENSFFSPDLGLDSIFLSFNQYYRNYSSNTRVEAFNFEAENWEPIFFNQLDTNVESSNKQQVVITIPKAFIFEFPLEGSMIQLRFIFEGSHYFWIVDDVRICQEFPYRETLPEYIGDTLAAFGYNYDIDCFGGAIVPNQMIVQFSPFTNSSQKDALRNKYGVIGVDSCQCSLLEQWSLPTGPGVAGLPPPGGALSPFGQSSDLNQLKKSMNAESEIDGADLNRFTWNELLQCPPAALPTIDPPSDIPANGTDAVLVAFLDSGVDRLHPNLKDQIWLNDGETNANAQLNVDEDNSCEPDDFIGWNFLGMADEEVNNPGDNSCVGHGTRVAGIINKQLSDSLSASQYKLMPLKTHDRDGVGNLFDALCAHYYAIDQGAKVINDSWGFYSLDSSEVLLNMLDTAMANNVLVVAAAGNDGIFLDTLQQYPACALRPNVLAVASVNGGGGNFTLSDFSNQSSTYIDIAALGENIVSTVPGGGTMESTGTSFSAPAVAGLAAYYYQQLGDNALVSEVLNNLFSCVVQQSDLNVAIAAGRVLAKDSCMVVVATQEPNNPLKKACLTIAPNPVSQYLNILSQLSSGSAAEISIYNLMGKRMLSVQMDQLAEGETWQFDLSNWPRGIYFVRLSLDNYIWTGKVLKQ